MIAYPPGFCNALISSSQFNTERKTHRQRMNFILMPLLTLPYRSEIEYGDILELAHAILHRTNLLRPFVGEEVECSLPILSLMSPLPVISRRIRSVMTYAMQLPKPHGRIGINSSNSTNDIPANLISYRVYSYDTRCTHVIRSIHQSICGSDNACSVDRLANLSCRPKRARSHRPLCSEMNDTGVSS